MSPVQPNTERPSRNILPAPTPDAFKSDASPLDNLQALAQHLEERTTGFILWFLQKKETPMRYSQRIRFLAILLTTLGGLCPLLANISLSICDVSLFDTRNLHQWGYILMALAAALVLSDRYFGCSNSWMRYMSAQVGLQRALDRFRLDWAFWRIQNIQPGSPLSGEQLGAAIILLSSFQKEVAQLMEQEFDSWLNDFKEQLSSLQNSINKGQKDKQPGKIIVRIDAPPELKGQRQILIDQQSYSQTPGNDAIINSIAPGSYLIGVRIPALGGQAELSASESVTVAAGQTAVVNLRLDASVPA